jgi:menaquinone-9 beta-reductase
MTSTTTTIDHSSYDAIVVGARCAGSATAMLLARGGLRVLAIDRSTYGSDTLSTHALMRGGVLQLSRWGLLDAVRAGDTPPVRTTTFHYGGEPLEIAIKDKGGVGALYAPRRTVLDALLADAARDAGAEVRHGVRASDLTCTPDGRVTGVVLEDAAGGLRKIESGIVIGADGAKSQVARLAGARVIRKGRHGGAVVYGYFAGLRATGYHWHFTPGVSAGAIPTGGGLTCVFAMLPAARYAAEQMRGAPGMLQRALVEAAPALSAELASARQVGGLYKFAGRPGFVRQAHGPGFALVGDAGTFADPCTAHGITSALRDAELVARAVLAGGGQSALAAYQATRDTLAPRFMEVADAVASFQWDLPQVRALHETHHELMVRELRLLGGFETPATEAA